MKLLSFMLLGTLSSSAFASTKNTNIIYGKDNRIDISDVQNFQIKEIAKSVAARIDKWSYQNSKSDSQNLISFLNLTLISDEWDVNLCKDEKFSNQPVLSDCSGFLVGEDILVTAGHCMTDEGVTVKGYTNHECSYYDWIFDYETNKDGIFDGKNLSSENIYKCKKIIFATLTDNDDFAVIQLDRKVTGRKALTFRTTGEVKNKDSIFVIGHPSGLPKKFSDGAKVINNTNKEYFTTNLDTFGGNSGSPVFNEKTLEIEGILVRGRTDYRDSFFEGKSCLRVNTCKENGKNCNIQDNDIDGEEVTRITELLKYIQ